MDLIRAERGLISKVARALGVTRSAIAMWHRVPAERVVEVEKASGIPRHKLRPDLHLEPDDPEPKQPVVVTPEPLACA